MLLPPVSGRYSEMGAIFRVAISFSIQRKLGGKTKKKYEFIWPNGIQFPRFLFSSLWMDQSILAPFLFHLAALRQIFRSLIVEWIKARSTCKSLNMTFPLNQNQSPQSHSLYLRLYPNLMKSAFRWEFQRIPARHPKNHLKHIFILPKREVDGQR